MAAIDINELISKYEGFYEPTSRVYLGGANPEENKKNPAYVVDIIVEVTSDLKASIATFSLINVYSYNEGAFRTNDIKKFIAIGTDVKILLGHAMNLTTVFVGYIAGVDFLYNAEAPGESMIRITAMDIKGVMMANNSSKRLKANYYSDAVKEILDGQTYQNLKNNNIITDLSVSDTPDKPAGGAMGAGGAGGGEVDNRIEMVAESDYEFVVKAARKFNYEFFTVGGNVVFRAAKLNTEILAELSPGPAIIYYDVGYDITGIVGEVKVRTMDIGKANKIEVKKKNANKVSIGSKAKPLISNQSFVYVDSAIETQTDADNRAQYILEDMSYRLGHIKMILKGMPEFVPGRFIQLKGFGDAVSNKFYITDVTHEYMAGVGYTTTIEGKASTL